MKSKKARSKAPTKRKKRSSLVRRTATRTKARSISVKPKVVRKTRKKAVSARAKIKVKSVSKTRSSSDISKKLRSVRSSSTSAKQQEAPPTKVVATTFSKRRSRPVLREQKAAELPPPQVRAVAPTLKRKQLSESKPSEAFFAKASEPTQPATPSVTAAPIAPPKRRKPRTKPVTPEESQLGVPLSSAPPSASAMPQKAAQGSTQGSKPLSSPRPEPTPRFSWEPSRPTLNVRKGSTRPQRMEEEQPNPVPQPTKSSAAPSRSEPTKPLTTSLIPPAPTSSQPEPSIAEEKPAARSAVSQGQQAEKPAAPLPHKIPPILLEGDESSKTSFPTAPQKYALGPRTTTPDSRAQSELRELPEAYGTGKMFLTARDPHTLYTHWDFTDQQQRNCNAQSRHHHLMIRIHRERLQSTAISEVHVHPESRHWFLHVDHAAAKYVVELGYYRQDGSWITVANSGAVVTPPEVVSEDKTVRFDTIKTGPSPSTPAQVSGHSPPAGSDSPRPSHAEQLGPTTVPAASQPDWSPTLRPEPAPAHVAPRDFNSPIQTWTPAQELALSEEINFGPMRREWVNSIELAELMKSRVQQEIRPLEAGQFAFPAPSSDVLAMPGEAPPLREFISSPFGGEEQPKGRAFWFNINAELIIYGATEPDATVTIGDRKIRLRPDGTFSYRFALPDGSYELPVAATSTDNDVRRAELSFSRGTEYSGEVGMHPQDETLKPPVADNVG